MVQSKKKLLHDRVFDKHVHRPLALLVVERIGRGETDPLVLDQNPQRMHPVLRRRKGKLRIRLAARFIYCPLLDYTVVEHDGSAPMKADRAEQKIRTCKRNLRRVGSWKTSHFTQL